MEDVWNNIFSKELFLSKKYYIDITCFYLRVLEI